MARRRLSLDAIPPAAPETKSMLPPATAPIAQVAGDVATRAALAELADELTAARAGGRLVVALALDAVEADWIARDRLPTPPEDLAELAASIRDRGQQAPIEVVALDDGRFGLISGWRRLQALRQLHTETGEDRFAQVQALLRRPETAADAYRAMVEENEIRQGLSYFERARIAALAAEAGVHPDPRAAVAALFAAASRAKRSKIGAFLALHAQLGDRLRFGPAIPERLGLALARALEADPSLAPRLRERLRKSAPETAAAELALLERALRPDAGPDSPPSTAPETVPADPGAPVPADPGAPETAAAARATPRPPHREEICPGVTLDTEGGFSAARLTLSGPKVDGPFRDRLVAWLRTQG